MIFFLTMKKLLPHGVKQEKPKTIQLHKRLLFIKTIVF